MPFPTLSLRAGGDTIGGVSVESILVARGIAITTRCEVVLLGKRDALLACLGKSNLEIWSSGPNQRLAAGDIRRYRLTESCIEQGTRLHLELESPLAADLRRTFAGVFVERKLKEILTQLVKPHTLNAEVDGVLTGLRLPQLVSLDWCREAVLAWLAAATRTWFVEDDAGTLQWLPAPAPEATANDAFVVSPERSDQIAWVLSGNTVTQGPTRGLCSLDDGKYGALSMTGRHLERAAVLTVHTEAAVHAMLKDYSDRWLHSCRNGISGAVFGLQLGALPNRLVKDNAGGTWVSREWLYVWSEGVGEATFYSSFESGLEQVLTTIRDQEDHAKTGNELRVAVGRLAARGLVSVSAIRSERLSIPVMWGWHTLGGRVLSYHPQAKPAPFADAVEIALDGFSAELRLFARQSHLVVDRENDTVIHAPPGTGTEVVIHFADGQPCIPVIVCYLTDANESLPEDLTGQIGGIRIQSGNTSLRLAVENTGGAMLTARDKLQVIAANLALDGRMIAFGQRELPPSRSSAGTPTRPAATIVPTIAVLEHRALNPPQAAALLTVRWELPAGLADIDTPAGVLVQTRNLPTGSSISVDVERTYRGASTTIETLELTTDGNGIARGQWRFNDTYSGEPDPVPPPDTRAPRYRLRAKFQSDSIESHSIAWYRHLRLTADIDSAHPLPKYRVRVIDAEGEVNTSQTDETGSLVLKQIPVGPIWLDTSEQVSNHNERQSGDDWIEVAADLTVDPSLWVGERRLERARTDSRNQKQLAQFEDALGSQDEQQLELLFPSLMQCTEHRDRGLLDGYLVPLMDGLSLPHLCGTDWQRITQCSANDGLRGRISGDGKVSLRPDEKQLLFMPISRSSLSPHVGHHADSSGLIDQLEEVKLAPGETARKPISDSTLFLPRYEPYWPLGANNLRFEPLHPPVSVQFKLAESQEVPITQEPCAWMFREDGLVECTTAHPGNVPLKISGDLQRITIKGGGLSTELSMSPRQPTEIRQFSAGKFVIVPSQSNGPVVETRVSFDANLAMRWSIVTKTTQTAKVARIAITTIYRMTITIPWCGDPQLVPIPTPDRFPHRIEIKKSNWRPSTFDPQWQPFLSSDVLQWIKAALFLGVGAGAIFIALTFSPPLLIAATGVLTLIGAVGYGAIPADADEVSDTSKKRVRLPVKIDVQIGSESINSTLK